MNGRRGPWLVELRRAVSWHRRLLAAGLAAGAAAFTISAVEPDRPDTVAVLATARDLPGGSPLSEGDLRVVELPAGVVPDGSISAGEPVVGQLLAGPARRGEPLTDARLVGPGLLRGYDEDLVAAPVRVADPGTARLVESGDVVDVVAAPTGMDADLAGSRAQVAASAVRVLAVPRGTDRAAALTEGALIVLATTPDTAVELARAAVTSRLTLTLRSR
ncbi:MAG: Flp pilus assembly protein CpaB [Carbonactinosporaceae bacterium]